MNGEGFTVGGYGEVRKSSDQAQRCVGKRVQPNCKGPVVAKPVQFAGMGDYLH